MSEATLTTSEASTGAVVVPTASQVSVPQGQRDTRYSYDKNGVLRLNADGSPKAKGKAKGKKKTLKEYTTPTGGLQSSETPGFDVNEMRQLKQSDFADVLDYAKWRVWFFEQKLSAAKAEVSTVQASGTTPEERKENSRNAALVTQLERMIASGKGTKFADRIGELFAKMESAK